MKRVVFTTVLLVLAACSQPAPRPAADNRTTPPRAVLPDGFTIDLELALTPEEVANGLMFRPSLPEHRGMLFVFGQSRKPAFWMKNMLIPLDLVFLNSAGVVVDVIVDVPPCAADPCPNYPPSNPALAVLEINAGSAAAHGIEVGTKLHFERVPGYPISNSEF